jgi:hypothetical protein
LSVQRLLEVLDMESELRTLIGKYGMRAVHEGLMKEMRDTFQYLQVVFEPKNEIIYPIVNHLPTVEFVKDTIPEGIRPAEVSIDTDSLYEEEVVLTEIVKDPTVKEIQITDAKTAKAVAAQQQPQQSPPFFPPVEVKQQKAKHREEVDKKRLELVAKGMKPESLLTEENLKKWLGAGQSYLKIAKETGVHESQVASVAKSFGLQSNISKYVAMKKKN